MLLGSKGVIVIVVGNYLCAAFYEASGASTCHNGFNIHVETNASPIKVIVIIIYNFFKSIVDAIKNMVDLRGKLYNLKLYAK